MSGLAPLELIDTAPHAAQGTPEHRAKMAKNALISHRRRRDPQYLVDLARKQTDTAIKTLIELMTSEEQPGMVRIRCAEILVERGWGKSWQGVVVADAHKSQDGIQSLPIMDRVQALLKASNDAGQVMDLEASAVTEEDDLV